MVKLTANRRDAVGTRKVRGLRKKNLIPGVIYGHAQENIPVALDAHDLKLALHHGERLLELDVEGQVQNVLVKDVQYDAMQEVVLHVDLARVDLDELVEVTVPLILRGTPVGVTEGGVVHQQAAEIDLECAVRQIPEDIRVPINDMKIGDMLHMRDVKLPEGITLEPPDTGSMLVIGVGAVPCVTLRIKGIDKQQVGEFAARLRRIKPPEPYKAKGIRYEGEAIHRKAGKAFATQE